ncbi:MAG: serine/threonine-protein phosphatase, partial [Planctomycetes bacterium]|nr:serine/threonine-protein phosphatase [Planctomycetota bacterium]
HSAQQMVERINETLWTASAGDQFASLFYAMIQPDSGKIEHAAAGHVYAAIVGDALRPIATADTTPLGTQPDAEYRASHDELASGEVLVVFSEGIKKAVKSKGGRVLWRLIQRNRERSADELADKFRSFLDRHFDQAAIEDQTVLVVKRVPH